MLITSKNTKFIIKPKKNRILIISMSKNNIEVNYNINKANIIIDNEVGNSKSKKRRIIKKYLYLKNDKT